MRPICLLLLCIALGTNTINACTCDDAGSFLTVAPNTDLVALVKVNKYLNYAGVNKHSTPMSMEVELVKTIYGNDWRNFLVTFT